MRSFRQGADVEIVHTTISMDAGAATTRPGSAGDIPRSEPAAALDDVGGVAAILRFVP